MSPSKVHLTSGRSGAGFYVSLTTISYVTWWVGIATVHVICMGSFVLVCWAYWRIPNTNIAIGFEMYGVIMPLEDFHGTSLAHGAIACAHGVSLIEMIIASVWSRRLDFLVPAPNKLFTREKNLLPSYMDKSPAKLIHYIARVRSTGFYLYDSVFGRRGLLGVEGKHFALIYITRELFEIVLQSIQAYHMSRLVPRAAVNHFFVSIIVLNCWSTTIIQHVFRLNPPLERLLCLIFDVTLDFVSTVGIPMIISLPYLKQYEFDIQDFPYALWYDDIWLVNMIHELQLIFISSWSDLATQLIFSGSLLMNLRAVKRLLRMRPTDTEKGFSARATMHPGATISSSPANGGLNVVPAIYPRKKNVAVEMPVRARSRLNSFIPSKATSTRLQKIAHAILSLWGLFILVLHVRASFGSVPSHCIAVVRPWFSTKLGCALMYVNCKIAEEATGNLVEMIMAMDSMDEYTLLHVVIRHCPHVEIPSRLQAFPNLIGLKIYNSTLVNWDAEAALTGKHHQKIVFLFVVNVNMTHLPMGLQSSDFPQQLLDIEFCGTNLTTLPDDLDQKWPSYGLVAFERSQFDSVPDTLKRMSFRYLSMAQNLITELPSELLTSPSVLSLLFYGNPIQTLPSVRTSNSFYWFDATFSQLQTLPAWIDVTSSDQPILNAGGTPLCKQILAAGANASAIPELSEAWEAYQKRRLRCREFTGIGSTNYPYQVEPLLDSKYL